jgi:hypothetical protein
VEFQERIAQVFYDDGATYVGRPGHCCIAEDRSAGLNWRRFRSVLRRRRAVVSRLCFCCRRPEPSLTASLQTIFPSFEDVVTLAEVRPACLLAAKGYDTGAVRPKLGADGTRHVIPPKSNAKATRRKLTVLELAGGLEGLQADGLLPLSRRSLAPKLTASQSADVHAEGAALQSAGLGYHHPRSLDFPSGIHQDAARSSSVSVASRYSHECARDG